MHARDRARFDWKDGVSIDENPYPKNTPEHRAYHDELQAMFAQEFHRAAL